MRTLRLAWRTLGTLDGRIRRRYFVLLAGQVALAAVDLVGVVILGFTVLVATASFTGAAPPDFVVSIMRRIGLTEALSGPQLLVIFVLVLSLFLAKMATGLMLVRFQSRLLAKAEIEVAQRLVSGLMLADSAIVQRLDGAQTAYAVTRGATLITVQVLGQLSVVFADLAVISAIALAVIYYSPFGALALVLCITLWMGSQHLLIGPAVHHVGVLTAELQATATGAVEDAIGIHSEAGVMGREAGIERSLMTVRRELAQNSSREYYFTQVPRFSIEVGLLLTLGITGMTVVLTQSATSAAASLAVILAGVTRILPSIVRLQNSTLLLRSIQGAAETAVTLEKAFEGSSERSGDSRGTPDAEHPPAEIVIHDLSFAWPNSAAPLFQHVQLRIAAGSRVAIIGPSGAGKSTLCDLILGFRSPTEGQILINGQLPRSYLHKLPGAVGYVPQSVWLVRGSIRSNVALGIPNEEIDGHRVSTALRKAGLTDVVCAAPDGIETVVGTGGLRLSGGQVQRLGIARALYASPSLLVMDEPSSALDAESENDLAIVLDGLLGSVTVLVVAHRPRLMEAADLVVSVSAGEVTTRLGTISAR